MRERIIAERTEFRERIDPPASRARWDRQRQAALARAAKAARARQDAWWDSLTPEDRQQRRTAFSAVFTALSPAEQARRKHALAEQRARAGEHERARYDAWLAQLTSTEREQRSIDRALTYAARPRHDQQQLAAAWAEHRTRWRLPHHHRPRAATASTAPEAELLRRPIPDIDELTLFDADHRTSPAPAAATA